MIRIPATLSKVPWHTRHLSLLIRIFCFVSYLLGNVKVFFYYFSKEKMRRGVRRGCVRLRGKRIAPRTNSLLVTTLSVQYFPISLAGMNCSGRIRYEYIIVLWWLYPNGTGTFQFFSVQFVTKEFVVAEPSLFGLLCAFEIPEPYLTPIASKPFLKGQCHEIFDLYFFHESNPSGPLINRLKWFFLKICFRVEFFWQASPLKSNIKCWFWIVYYTYRFVFVLRSL